MSGILLLTIICMSGIFLLTLYVRYITSVLCMYVRYFSSDVVCQVFPSDYSDLLGLSSLLACQAILWYGSWILKHTYVNRNQFTLYVQCCLVYPVYCTLYLRLREYAIVLLYSYCIFNYMYIHIPWTCGVIYTYISLAPVYIYCIGVLMRYVRVYECKLLCVYTHF